MVPAFTNIIRMLVTEHSENKIITQSGLFENEVGPGVLQSSIQQTNINARRIQKAQTKCNSFCVDSVRGV